MAWEWVAPVATAAGASIGTITTWLVASGGRQHAEKVAHEAHAHAERMADRARQQDRLASAYVDLLRMIEQTGHWASRVYPIFDTDPPAELPPMPSPDEQTRVRALVGAYGSESVDALFDEYSRTLTEMIASAEDVAWSRSDAPGSDRKSEIEARRRIEQDLRPAEREKRLQIAKQVRTELAGVQT